MYQRKLEKDIRCPLEYGLNVFGGRWKARIICVLALRGQQRYSSLRGKMANITDAVLSRNLKELQASGIVERLQYNEIPPRVKYSLTGKGMAVIPVLQCICQWAVAYHTELTDSGSGLCSTCDCRRGKEEAPAS